MKRLGEWQIKNHWFPWGKTNNSPKFSNETIDEEKISKLLFEECPYEVTRNERARVFAEGFIAGYKKAKEEKV